MRDIVERLPEGSLIKVQMEIRVPKEATQKEIEEWLHYSLEQSGGISLDNPLLNETAEAWGVFGFHWEDTGTVGHKEKFDVVKTDDGETYKVRYHRDRRPS